MWDPNGNKLVTFDLMSTGGSKQIKTNEVVQRYNTMIAVTALADFVLLGQQAVGSFALASNKTEIFASALGAWTTSIADTFNRVEVPRLFALNGWSGPLPKIEAGDIEERDLGPLGEFLSKLPAIGIDFTGDLDVEQYLRRAAGLPDKKAEAEIEEEPEAARTNKLLETVGGISAIIDMNTAIQEGRMDQTAAVAIMVNILGVDEAAATKMLVSAGKVTPPPKAE